MNRRIVIDGICFVYVFLFLYAATSKLLDVEQFTVLIGQSPLLTDMAAFVAWFIPILEILIAIALLLPRFRLMGLMAAFSLMVAFTAYIIAILQFSEHIPCSCGGVLSTLGWKEHLVFNLTFVFLAAIGIYLSLRESSARNDVAFP